VTIKQTMLAALYRQRLHAKRALSFAGKVLPKPMFEPLRAIAEQVVFRARPEHQADTLPPIFHYWSQRHLEPRAQRAGISSAEDLYLSEIRRAATTTRATLAILSVGSGACDMEIALAARLKQEDISAHLTCIDFNADLLRHASKQAAERGLSDALSFVELDCNRHPQFPASDVIIVNQFFHHVENLEDFCAGLRRALSADGRLVTSDIIGRNGHMLWPDVEAAVLRFWMELPDAQRMDRYFGKIQRKYRPMDHSAYSNEGIRAQDVVACLADAFDFELFFTFGGSIMPFVERRIGFNFDPDVAADRLFIDRVDAEDTAALNAGNYPPSNMIATLRHKGRVERPVFDPIAPADYLLGTALQKGKLQSKTETGRRKVLGTAARIRADGRVVADPSGSSIPGAERISPGSAPHPLRPHAKIRPDSPACKA
jgi:2-polyprenyl-3-methyl-5-hydroxy-6-metoxy-1,4-benzoquinol methylase